MNRVMRLYLENKSLIGFKLLDSVIQRFDRIRTNIVIYIFYSFNNIHEINISNELRDPLGSVVPRIGRSKSDIQELLRHIEA